MHIVWSHIPNNVPAVAHKGYVLAKNIHTMYLIRMRKSKDRIHRSMWDGSMMLSRHERLYYMIWL